MKYAVLSHVFASLLLTLGYRAPELFERSSETGLAPEPLNPGDPVDRVYLSVYRSVVSSVCRTCPHRGACPWWTALRSSTRRSRSTG